MAPQKIVTQLFSSKLYLPDTIEFICKPLYQDKSFLHHLYIEKGLTIEQIAAKIVSSKNAVRDGLLKFDIPIRENKPPRFGEKKVKGEVKNKLSEKRIIEAIVDMRKKGMGLRMIANMLTKMKVPTAKGGKKWYPEVIKRVLMRKGNYLGSHTEISDVKLKIQHTKSNGIEMDR